MSKTIIVFNEDSIEELTEVSTGFPIPMTDLKDMIDNLCDHFEEGKFSYIVRYDDFEGEEIAILCILPGETVTEEDLEFFATDYQELLTCGIENFPVDSDLGQFVNDVLEKGNEEWEEDSSDSEEDDSDDADDDYDWEEEN